MFVRALTATVALIVSLTMLVGCNQQAGDENVRAVLKSTCPAVAQAYLYYEAVAAAGVLSERTVARVMFAKQQADMLCAAPETATTNSVLAAGALVYASTRDAIKEAKAKGADVDAGSTVGYAGELRKLEGLNARLKRGLDHAR
jgi:hypothetical protein